MYLEGREFIIDTRELCTWWVWSSEVWPHPRSLQGRVAIYLVVREFFFDTSVELCIWLGGEDWACILPLQGGGAM